MSRTTLLVTVTALFLAYTISVALISINQSEENAYLDDLTVTIDGITTLSQDFTNENQSRLITEYFVDEQLVEGIFIGRSDVAIYSSSEYHSPPHGLGIAHPSNYGTALLVRAELPSGWREMNISYYTKITGVPPSQLNTMLSFDYGSGVYIVVGDKDILTGNCQWLLSSGWSDIDDIYNPYSASGYVSWDWSVWHRLDFIFSRDSDCFRFYIDGAVLFAGRFTEKDASVIVLKIYKA